MNSNVILFNPMPSATIKIFLVHGDAKRLRTAELSNWTGKAVAAPRNEFDGLLARDEAAGSGVYFLTGLDPETGRSAVYIGEAEAIRDRLKSHLEKDFWNHIVFFVSKDENLTKAHIRYLEGRLIEQAKQAGRAVVTNSQGSGAKLPESDREDMEIFLQKIHQLMPALGTDFLVPTTVHQEATAKKDILIYELKGLKATATQNAAGFVVFKNSQAALEERPAAHKYPWVVNFRKRLIDDGTLVANGKALTFSKDTEFPSPSTAAAVVCGGTANGLTVWKNKDGKTLKELESV
ncbi:GIY-YIG nuclease family protein [Dechloromonas denitrificans]|nr:GIY-YIG nuclease family protein [Dechloromonas denitrificans]